jgi:hypothetical protein
VELGESDRSITFTDQKKKSITLVKKLSHNYKFDPLIALHQCFVRERKRKKKKTQKQKLSNHLQQIWSNKLEEKKKKKKGKLANIHDKYKMKK